MACGWATTSALTRNQTDPGNNEVYVPTYGGTLVQREPSLLAPHHCPHPRYGSHREHHLDEQRTGDGYTDCQQRHPASVQTHRSPDKATLCQEHATHAGLREFRCSGATASTTTSQPLVVVELYGYDGTVDMEREYGLAPVAAGDTCALQRTGLLQWGAIQPGTTAARMPPIACRRKYIDIINVRGQATARTTTA